jgi:cytoskeletal protein RodZ
MERHNKKIMLIIMLIGIFLLTGCNKFHLGTFNASDEEKSGTEVTLTPNDNQDEPITGSEEEKEEDTNSDEEETTPTPSSIQPTANIDLTVYTVNVDTGDIETVTALVTNDSEITPKLIVNTVIESMADKSIVVGIDSVTSEGDTVIVSFTKEQAPFSEVGAGYETAILDAIAQSLTDNLEEYSKVIYRVEGKAYVSGHIEMEADEVYFEDN